MNSINYLKQWNREHMSGWRWIAVLAVVIAFLDMIAGGHAQQNYILLALICDIKHDVETIIKRSSNEQGVGNY